MKSLNKLNDVFNVDTEVDLPLSVPSPSSETLKQDDDFELARDTLRGLIHKNGDALDELVHIAKNSEHPRAFEVVGKLVEAQTTLAKSLMDIHKQKKEVTGEESTNIKTQNNVIFAGSTAELMKAISASKVKPIDI